MKQRGLSLLELLITVAVVVVLLFIGIPSFRELIRNNQITNTANTLVGALYLTRSEAIKRGQRVTLCKTNNAIACGTSADFSRGWIVFTDQNENAQVDGGETIIRVFDDLPTGLQVFGAGLVSDYVSYISDGTTKTTDGDFQFGTIVVCTNAQRACIEIGRTGRLSTTENCTCTP